MAYIEKQRQYKSFHCCVVKRHCSTFPFLEIRRAAKELAYKQLSIKACCERHVQVCVLAAFLEGGSSFNFSFDVAQPKA